MVNKPYISLQGFEKLTLQIKSLKQQADDLTRQMKENRENETGDESENVEMIRLMGEREAISEKYAELEEFCASCNVVDIEKLPEETKIVRFATTVKLLDINTDKHYTYTIMGDKEASPRDNIISYLSPIGKALMNEHVENIVSIETPSGERELEILSISRHGIKKGA
jgi:transcription elongation factor GreA